MNWIKCMEYKTKLKFYEKLENMVDICAHRGCEELCNCVMIFAKDEVRVAIHDNEGWFELSKDELMPLTHVRNKWPRIFKLFEGNDDFLKHKHRDYRKNLQHAVVAAKGKWIEKSFEKLEI